MVSSLSWRNESSQQKCPFLPSFHFTSHSRPPSVPPSLPPRPPRPPYRQCLGGVSLRQDECAVLRVPPSSVVGIVQLGDASESLPLAAIGLLQVLAGLHARHRQHTLHDAALAGHWGAEGQRGVRRTPVHAAQAGGHAWTQGHHRHTQEHARTRTQRKMKSKSGREHRKREGGMYGRKNLTVQVQCHCAHVNTRMEHSRMRRRGSSCQWWCMNSSLL